MIISKAFPGRSSAPTSASEDRPGGSRSTLVTLLEEVDGGDHEASWAGGLSSPSRENRLSRTKEIVVAMPVPQGEESRTLSVC